jgi:hypothetical protein
MTLGSVVSLGKKVHYFGKRVQYHHRQELNHEQTKPSASNNVQPIRTNYTSQTQSSVKK